eukprot:17613-Heterococcus_DN1.PRE.2
MRSARYAALCASAYGGFCDDFSSSDSNLLTQQCSQKSCSACMQTITCCSASTSAVACHADGQAASSCGNVQTTSTFGTGDSRSVTKYRCNTRYAVAYASFDRQALLAYTMRTDTLHTLCLLCMLHYAHHQVIAIASDDPLADKLHDIADVEKHCPGVVSGIREWFRWYKTPDDKPINEFGFGERAITAKETLAVISECNGHWKDLLSGKAEAGKMWKP